MKRALILFDLLIRLVVLIATIKTFGFWWMIPIQLLLCAYSLLTYEVGFCRGFICAHNIHGHQTRGIEPIIAIGRWFNKVLWSDGKYS